MIIILLTWIFLYSLGVSGYKLRGESESWITPNKNVFKYGFSPAVLFTHRFTKNPSFIISSWPHKLELNNLKPDITIGIGQNLANNLVTKQILHLITDKLSGYALPVENITTVPLSLPVSETSWFGKKTGEFVVVISNVRVHKIRITKFTSPDPQKVRVDDNLFGGEFSDDRKRKFWEKQFIKGLHDRSKEAIKKWKEDSIPVSPEQLKERKLKQQEKLKEQQQNRKKGGTPDNSVSEEYMTWQQRRQMEEEKRLKSGVEGDKNYKTSNDDSQQLLYFGEDRLHISVRGLNIVLTADYEIVGKSGWLSTLRMKGRVWLRALNSVAVVEAIPTFNPLTGAPSIEIPTLPSIFFGEIQTRFDDTKHDSLLSSVSATFIKYFGRAFPILVSKVVQDEGPKLTESLLDIVDTRLITSVNEFLTAQKFPPKAWPQLALEDLRWKISQFQLILGLNIRHISPEEQEQMLMEQKEWLTTHRAIDEQSIKGPRRPAVYVNVNLPPMQVRRPANQQQQRN